MQAINDHEHPTDKATRRPNGFGFGGKSSAWLTSSRQTRRNRMLREIFRPWRPKLVLQNDAEKSNEVDFSSILPSLHQGNGSIAPNSADMRWYDYWVRKQIEEQPGHLFQPLVDQNDILGPGCLVRFEKLWTETALFMVREELLSVDSIVQLFKERGILTLQESSEAFSTARALVFAVIGWQTMLYKADFGSSPTNQLSIMNELDGYFCPNRMVLKQKDNTCKRPICEMLLGFGILLPPGNFHPGEPPDDKKAFDDFKIVESSSCNAYVLETIGRVTIKWVDSLSCHLVLNPSAKVLYLYRYPSFCLANLNGTDSEQKFTGPLHACASPSLNSRPWAAKGEISQLFIETVATYRLLFGQTKTGRQLYRRLRPFDGIPEERHDKFLAELCGRKHGQLSNRFTDREVYDLARDFPIYRARLASIQHCLSMRKARTWRELWKDKRDSAQWFTFWAVVVFGGLGILLAFLQVVLQVVQIGLSTP